MTQKHATPTGRAICVLAALTTAWGCASNTVKLTELERVKSGMMEVLLLSPRDGLRHGKDTFVIEFRSASDGRLIDVGKVRGTANMPMAGMPMLGSIEVTKADAAGRYEASGDFQMAGTWRITLQWQGPTGDGSVTFPETIR